MIVANLANAASAPCCGARSPTKTAPTSTGSIPIGVKVVTFRKCLMVLDE